jgi:hypothetical protein
VSPKAHVNTITHAIRQKSVSPKNSQQPKKKKSKRRKDRSKEIIEDIGLMLPVIEDPKRKRYISNLPNIGLEVSEQV